MPLALVSTDQIAQAEDVNQFTRLLTGQAGYGQAVALTQLNDAGNYALTLKNLDTTNSKGLLVQDASGNTLLAVDVNGVAMSKLAFTPTNANIAAETNIASFAGVTYTMTNTVATERFYRFRIPTLAANAARTTTTAATVAIEGAPVASGTGPVTITNAYALWVEAGASRFDGALSIGSGGLTVVAGGATVTAGGLTVSAGGATVTGNSTVTGTLNVTSTLTAGGVLTVSAGGAAITGNSTVTGTLGVTSALTVTAGGLTVSAGGATIVGNSAITGTLNVTSTLSQNGATVATLTGTEALTNKTLTSPTLGGTVAGTPTWASAQTFVAVNTSQGSITTDVPTLSLATTWNAAGVTFTAAKLNVTNTASAAASKLLDLQLGGTSFFQVRKDGAVTIGATGFGITGDALRINTDGATYIFRAQLSSVDAFVVDGNGVTTCGSPNRAVADVIVAQAQSAGNSVFRAAVAGVDVFKIDGNGYVTFGAAAVLRSTTVGAAGGASALPATPSEYLVLTINGNQRKIPLYAP